MNNCGQYKANLGPKHCEFLLTGNYDSQQDATNKLFLLGTQLETCSLRRKTVDARNIQSPFVKELEMMLTRGLNDVDKRTKLRVLEAYKLGPLFTLFTFSLEQMNIADISQHC